MSFPPQETREPQAVSSLPRVSGLEAPDHAADVYLFPGADLGLGGAFSRLASYRLKSLWSDPPSKYGHRLR